MVVGAVRDGQGRPICGARGPGNTTEVTTLIPVVDRLRSRFGGRRVGIVADRGMIRQETIETREDAERGGLSILGARMRSPHEVKDEVLSRAGRSRVVPPKRAESTAPSPLKVKAVGVDDRRSLVGRNEDEACKEAADREAIVAALREQLRAGAKALIGHPGDRRSLSGRDSPPVPIDEAKIAADACADGQGVLRTTTARDSAEVALQDQQRGLVAPWFRSCKTLLQTRPIDPKWDATIRGPVFCSFLALLDFVRVGWQVKGSLTRIDGGTRAIEPGDDPRGSAA